MCALGGSSESDESELFHGTIAEGLLAQSLFDIFAYQLANLQSCRQCENSQCELKTYHHDSSPIRWIGSKRLNVNLTAAYGKAFPTRATPPNVVIICHWPPSDPASLP